MEFDRNSIGRIIREYRIKKGLTQEVASGLADMLRSHWSDIELGKKIPSLQTLWKMCAVLGVHPYEVVKAMEDSSNSYQGNK